MNTTINRLPTQPQHYSPPNSHLSLSHMQHAVRAARHHADRVLTGWGIPSPVIEDAVVVISELVTNAALHTRNGPAELHLLVQDQQLVIAVTDTCPDSIEHTVPREDSDDDHGRGLAIVRALACASGCHRVAGGKRVWAQMEVQAQAA
ncbi:ATP-binding protein [Streptomyces sp. MSC1_001]|jgi:anti-sigma regulatory factor (Ser/Thr protein kinase)|uniref:ATP-binding protein n=1 Tax=Streptomyces sp. MSC1_001 TaxID=2909263 RepID=UPI00203034FB|nr:ATP-binding protein [Streptomyces sp. MSC1_001]